MSAKKRITTYANGAEIRLHNRSIKFAEMDGGFRLEFMSATENADQPASGHLCLRGKVRVTTLCLSNEALESLVVGYVQFQKEKRLAELMKESEPQVEEEEFYYLAPSKEREYVPQYWKVEFINSDGAKMTGYAKSPGDPSVWTKEKVADRIFNWSVVTALAGMKEIVSVEPCAPVEQIYWDISEMNF